MRYFRVKIGYGSNEFIPIDETELEMALYVFINDSKAVFKNGVVRGKDIIAITEDWNKALGINPEWKLDADDWNQIERKGIKSEYSGVLGAAKEKVQYLIETRQQNLIGKNVTIPQLKAK